MKINIAKGRSKKGPEYEVIRRYRRREEIAKLCPDNPDKEMHDVRMPREDWEKFGFLFDMTIDEARERAKQLNAQEQLVQGEIAKAKNEKRLKKESLVKSAYLPTVINKEFEDKLAEDYYGEDFLRSKQMSHWRAAQKIIRKAKVKPSDYEDRKRVFYKLFADNKWSMSYVEKVVFIINKWGRYSAKKQGKYFEPLPIPKGYDRSMIDDSYLDSGKTIKESAPLMPIDLNKQEGNFKPEQFRWLFISLWFGLRPGEVDALLMENEGKRWKLEETEDYQVLCIYQTKLTKVAREKRWKRIPCLYDEQIEALDMILNEEIKTPLVKTIKKYFGEQYNRYAGRKGFESLLRRKGIPIDFISRYLGHTSIERTYKNYQDTSKAFIPDI